MAVSDSEKAARLRALAAQFRDFAEQTHLADYRTRMLEMAEELDVEAVRHDHPSLMRAS